MTVHPNIHRVNRLLEKAGGYYSFEDILHSLEEGEMQSFTYGDSWAVTQILDFPQKRVLHIVFVVGDLEGSRKLEDQLIAFAEDQGLDAMVADGRRGWLRRSFTGWEPKSVRFVKEM